MFPPGQGATIGVDFMIKTIEIDNEKVKVINYYCICLLISLKHNIKKYFYILVDNMGDEMYCQNIF